MNKALAGAAALALLLLGGCTAPSERPGQASPTPAPAASTTTPTPTESVASAATPTPALVNNWVDLLRVHPEVVTDLIEAGLSVEQVAAQAAIRTGAGLVPIATVKVAFGEASGGALRSTGDCKVSSGACPTNALVEGLLPLIKPEGKEPLRDPSRGVLVVFNDDGHPRVLHGLNLNKR